MYAYDITELSFFLTIPKTINQKFMVDVFRLGLKCIGLRGHHVVHYCSSGPSKWTVGMRGNHQQTQQLPWYAARFIQKKKTNNTKRHTGAICLRVFRGSLQPLPFLQLPSPWKQHFFCLITRNNNNPFLCLWIRQPILYAPTSRPREKMGLMGQKLPTQIPHIVS